MAYTTDILFRNPNLRLGYQGKPYTNARARGARPMSAEAVDYVNRPAYETIAAEATPVKPAAAGGAASPTPPTSPAGGNVLGNALSKGANVLGAVYGAMQNLAEPSQRDQFIMNKAEQGDPAARNAMLTGGSNPLMENYVKQPVREMLGAVSDSASSLGNRVMEDWQLAAEDLGGKAKTTVDEFTHSTPKPANTQAQQGAGKPAALSDTGLPYTANKAGDSVSFTNPDGSGTGTIKGAGVGDKMQDGKGSFSVMKLESPLGNQPPVDPEAQMRMQLAQYLMENGPDASRQSLGQLVAAKNKTANAKNAFAMLGDPTDKTEQAYKLGQLQLEQEKLNKPDYKSVNTYDENGMINGQDLIQVGGNQQPANVLSSNPEHQLTMAFNDAIKRVQSQPNSADLINQIIARHAQELVKLQQRKQQPMPQ